MVELEKRRGKGRGMSSSSISNSCALSHESGPGEVGGVLPCENLVDDGEKDEATRVSASEVLVDVECLIALR